MATFRRFEDIDAWKKAREVTKLVYSETRQHEFSKDFGLCNQIRKACVSIMANIAEGFGRFSDKEFANFLNIAIGSAYEVQSHLYVALDQGYIGETTFTKLYNFVAEITRMLKSLSQHLRSS